MSRNHTIATAVLAALLWALPCHGLQSKRDPLTPQEVEQIRDATDRPAVRVKLYVGFIQERVTRLEVLMKNASTEQRGESLHDTLEEYTYLSDELQNNLDEYESYETNKQRPVPDVRKVLRDLQLAVPLWKAAIDAVPADKKYDFSRMAALDSTQSLIDGSKELIASQDAYFAKKKQDEKSQPKQGYVLP